MTSSGSIPLQIEFDPKGLEIIERFFNKQPRFVINVTGPKAKEAQTVRAMRRLFGKKEGAIIKCDDLLIRVSSVTVNGREVWPKLKRKTS